MKSRRIRSTADLAQAMGLSRWTVSRALNGHPEVGEETARRVREEAARAGFLPSLLGRSLRSGRTDLVGVCAPDPEEFGLTSKLSLLQRGFARHGFHVIVQFAGSGEEELAAAGRFSAMRCSGLVLIASQSGREDFPGGPLVHMDPADRGQRFQVRTDRAMAMRLIALHLAERGFRRIFTAGIFEGTGTYAAERLEGLRQGIRASRGRLAGEIIPLEASPGEAAPEDCARRFMELRSRERCAIVAVNDLTALAVRKHLSRLRIPADAGITGYDNSTAAGVVTPGLTTVDPGTEKVVEATVRHLVERMAGRRSAPLVIAPRLVVREST